jgi:hypothetical protein
MTPEAAAEFHAAVLERLDWALTAGTLGLGLLVFLAALRTVNHL